MATRERKGRGVEKISGKNNEGEGELERKRSRVKGEDETEPVDRSLMVMS